jgi:hypothetical protein
MPSKLQLRPDVPAPRVGRHGEPGMTLPFIPFPKVDEPTGDWAAQILRSGWDFHGKETENAPDQVKQFLKKIERENPRRRSGELSNADWDRLEAVLTDYKRAYHSGRRENSKRVSLWA